MKTDSINFARWLFEKLEIEPTFDFESEYKNYDFNTKPRHYGMVYLNFHIADFFGVDSEWLREKGRRRSKVQSRQIAQYIMKEFKHSETDIADFYHQNRSNIYNSISHIKDMIETDMSIEANVRAILKLDAFNLQNKQ